MFLYRRLVLVGRGSFHNSITRFSSSSSSSSNLDCRPMALQAKVDFLINLPDLDTAAKHARLAANSSAYVDDNVGQSAHYIDQTCNAIIKAMFDAKRYKDGFDLFNYFFHDSGIEPFKGYLNHHMKYYIDQGRLEKALEIYDSSRANSDTESLITKALVDAGKLDEAIVRLETPDFYAWSSDVCNTFFKGLGLYSLSSDVCNSLFKGLLRRGDVEKAYEVLGNLKGRSYVYDDDYDKIVVLSTTFMENLFELGKEEEALKCYNNLKLLKKVKEATTVNALLELLLKHGKKTEAWSVLEQVLDSEETNNLDSDTLNIMVNECFKMGMFNQASYTFNKVKALKLKYPEVRCYKNIITRFCERSMLLEAEHFFEEMCLDRLVKPDVSTYITMIDAYRKAGKNEDALRISNKMVDAFLGQVASLACL